MTPPNTASLSSKCDLANGFYVAPANSPQHFALGLMQMISAPPPRGQQECVFTEIYVPWGKISVVVNC